MYRRITLALGLLIVGLLSISVVAAQEEIVLRALIRPDEGGNVARYAQQFEEETGISVEVDFTSWAEIYTKTVTTLAGGGGGYDIVFIPSANAVEFASGGWFLPIDEAIPEDEQALWLEPVVDLYTYEDELIAMPWYAGGAHFVVNTAILEAAGIDPATLETWEDVSAACASIIEADPDVYCYTPSARHPGDFYYNWGTMAASSGESVINDDGSPNFEETGLAAFQFLRDGADAGWLNPAGAAMDDYETLIEFGTGSTAMMINSTWSVTQATQNPEISTVTDNSQIMLIPGWEGGPRSGGYLYAGGLGILQTSEHPEEALAFLQLLTSEEAQKQHAIDGANMPTRVSLYEDADIAEAWPGFEVLAEQLTFGFFPPQVTWFEEWRLSSASATQDVIAGRRTPQEAVDFLVSELARLSSE